MLGFRKALLTNPKLLIGAATGLTLGSYLVYNSVNKLEASEGAAIPPEYPWPHKELAGSYDAAAIRRGYKVYREICSACHGMNEIAFRNLNVAFTEEEIKVLANQVDVEGEPDSQGEPTTRKAKPFDYMQSPYKNEQAARAMNGGALPPDLSVIVKGRPHGEDYIFSLLTGYQEPPAGITLREGLYYNAYFPGGAIGMAPPISDGAVEFDDGTPATVSQMAKDVTTYLAYCAKPDEEPRKKMGLKVLLSLSLVIGLSWVHKRFKWSTIKNRTVVFRE
ncbi:hypothetical protein C9374_005288 [Naegleria lovaniensis]|uniref:Cytochrome c1 n=1 Tax=Naegleria lovaniensis TaxID=51637 RepID=A0AA88GR98_NAELO|nr:uncharacterized protein C9374_005288 [Naegleria lovaniensis]KAG2382708.1 hypothetical protein C9374_005288 [Naegleria lovaniensis]